MSNPSTKSMAHVVDFAPTQSLCDDEATVREALAGDPAAMRALIDLLSPAIHEAALRGLARRNWQRRALEHDAEDAVQEVLTALFDDNGRALRAWSPARGLSLASFVGLLARRHVDETLRSGRRSPWRHEPETDDVFEQRAANAADPERIALARNSGDYLVSRLAHELSPRGRELFHCMFVEERTVDEIRVLYGMTAEAVWAWRSRIARQARDVLAEPAQRLAIASRR